LTIPAGALGNMETIEITKVDAADLSPQLAATGATEVYEFEPDGLTFAVPVTLAFDLGPPDTSTPGTIQIALARPVSESGGVLGQPTASAMVVDATSQSLRTRVSHFSQHGLAIEQLDQVGLAITHPTELAPRQSGPVTLNFVTLIAGTSLSQWIFSEEGLSYDDVAFEADSGESFVSFDIQCEDSPVHSGTVQMIYDVSLPSGAHQNTLTYNFDVACVDAPAQITELTLVDIQAAFGHTGCEEMNLAEDGCVAGLWLGTNEGGVRLGLVGENEFQLENSFTSTGAITDVSSFQNSFNGESAFLATGAQDSFIIRNDIWGCTSQPGEDLMPIYRDTTPFDGGVISADAFVNQLTVNTIPDSGGLSTTSYTTSNFYRTAVANDDATAFVGVEFSPTRLTHMTVAGGAVQQENPGPVLGSDPRRMKWDSGSGLGAVTDFADSTVTLFHWSGDGTPPTFIDTVSVGSGPVGVDVYRNNVACTGYFDDTLSIIKVDLVSNEVLSLDTEVLDVLNPRGAGLPLNPAHVMFAPYMGDHVLGLSLYGADSLLFLPGAY
tara:strand:+ start:5704 stop:7356 length:1653 start_codon:yes stop_codon:yes gene_type:complete